MNLCTNRTTVLLIHISRGHGSGVHGWFVWCVYICLGVMSGLA